MIHNKCKNAITIITVSKSDLANLSLTLMSISEQSYLNYNLVLVISGCDTVVLENLLANTKIKNVKIILDDGTGIFNAMNIGLLSCESEYAMFLNGGDSFFDSSSLLAITNQIRKNNDSANIAFSVLQSYDDDNYLRLAKHKNRWFDFRYFPPPHQGFVANIDKANLFDAEDGNSADTFWLQRQIVLKGCHYESKQIIAKFQLGGISNNPLIFSSSDLFLRRIYKLLKYALAKGIGLRIYYRVMSFVAGFKSVDYRPR